MIPIAGAIIDIDHPDAIMRAILFFRKDAEGVSLRHAPACSEIIIHSALEL